MPRFYAHFAVVAVAQATFAAVAVAVAQPPAPLWSGPAAAPGPPLAQFQAASPSVAFGAGGRALVSDGRRTYRAQGARGALQPDSDLPLEAAPVPVGASGTAYLVGRQRRSEVRLRLAFGPSQRAVALSRRAQSGSAALVANGRGEVAAAWLEMPTAARTVVRMISGRRGRLGKVRTVATGEEIRRVVLALGDRGHLVVAYDGARGVDLDRPIGPRRAVRARTGSVRRLGPARRLGASEGFDEIDAAVAPSGAAVVAWGTQDTGEEAGRPWVVRAAIRAAGARRFGGAQLLDPGDVPGRSPGRVQAAISPAGAAAVGWSGVRAGDFPVRAAVAGPDGRFGAAEELSISASAGGALGDVAVRADGAFLAMWTRVPRSPVETQNVEARLRPAGATEFGPFESIPGPANAVRPAVAFDPASGEPLAAWVADADAGSPPGRVLHTSYSYAEQRAP